MREYLKDMKISEELVIQCVKFSIYFLKILINSTNTSKNERVSPLTKTITLTKGFTNKLLQKYILISSVYSLFTCPEANWYQLSFKK